MQEKVLLKLFKDNQLDFRLHNHESVFTVGECDHLHQTIPGAHSKNLFVKDKKKSFILISILEHKRVNLKALSKMLGKSGLSFGNADELFEKLKLTPGSVTPYALINDSQKVIDFILDKDFLQSEVVNFHPLRNDMTIEMPLKHFLEFFKIINHVPNIVEIPVLNESS